MQFTVTDGGGVLPATAVRVAHGSERGQGGCAGKSGSPARAGWVVRPADV